MSRRLLRALIAVVTGGVLAAGLVGAGMTPAVAGTGLTLGPASLPAPSDGQPYSQTLTASGGSGPYTFSVTSGAIPPGITLNTADGTLSGTPNAVGTFSFVIAVTDSLSESAMQAYELTVPVPVITLSPSSLPNAPEYLPYPPQTLTASGGVFPYSYRVTSGSLPPGLTLASYGLISGTPAEAGLFAFTVTAGDSTTEPSVFVGSRDYTILVPGPPTVNSISPANGTAGTVVTLTGTDLFPGSIVDFGSTPAAGFVVDSDSEITATVPPGSGTVGVSVTTPYGTSGTMPFTYDAPPLVFVGTALAPAIAGVPYSQQVGASGGEAPYTYALASGSSLPSGLTLSVDGTISGTDSIAGDATFSIVATDQNEDTSTASFSLHTYSSTIQATSTVADGGTIAVTGDGFMPGTYDVVLHSAPVTIGSAVVGSNGSLRFAGAIPAATDPGVHTIELTLGGTTIASAPVTVTAAVAAPSPTPTSTSSSASSPAAGLAETGSTIDSWPAVLAVLAIVAGAGAIALVRLRRQRAVPLRK